MLYHWATGTLLSYFLLASLEAAEVWTSSTALLKLLMFSEEYRPEGLLYMLVTTLGLPELKGMALLLWAEPICFTSYREKEQILWEYKSQKDIKQNYIFKKLFHWFFVVDYLLTLMSFQTGMTYFLLFGQYNGILLSVNYNVILDSTNFNCMKKIILQNILICFSQKRSSHKDLEWHKSKAKDHFIRIEELFSPEKRFENQSLLFF